MTLAKAKMDFVHFRQKVELLKNKYGRIVVYLDEMDAMKVNPRSGIVSVYSNKNASYFDCDPQQAQLMDYLFDATGLFVVLMSAEKGIDKALNARNLKPALVNNFCTLIDFNLAIAYVRSTSKRALEDKNTEFCKVVSKIESTYADYLVATNGLSEKQKQILRDRGLKLTTHEALKGNNDKQQSNIISIITYPNPLEIQQYLLSVGIDDSNKKESDELEAIRTIVSNRYNQTIGRNTGYRGDEAKHIAIIPIGLADLLDSYVVTTKHDVFDDVSNESDLELLTQLVAEQLDLRKQHSGDGHIIQGKKWFRELINSVYEATRRKYPKTSIGKNQLAKHFFESNTTHQRKSINGKQQDLYIY